MKVNRSCLLAGLLAFGMARIATAHQLDEYLQASIVSVSADRLTISLFLTPGANVAPGLLQSLQAESRDDVSAEAQKVYAGEVLQEVSLSLDHRPLQLHLLSWSFPKVQAIQEGRGDILLKFAAELPSGSGQRKLHWENRHQKNLAAYQVNSLQSADPNIHIVGQWRNATQSVYELSYIQSSPTHWSFFAAIFVGATVLCCAGGLYIWCNRNALIINGCPYVSGNEQASS